MLSGSMKDVTDLKNFNKSEYLIFLSRIFWVWSFLSHQQIFIKIFTLTFFEQNICSVFSHKEKNLLQNFLYAKENIQGR